MSLKEIILAQAQKEVDEVLKLLEAEKQQLEKELTSKTDQKVDGLLVAALKEKNRLINEKMIEFQNEKKSLILKEKNQQIEKVLSLYKDHILKLDDQGLFDYVCKLIYQENIAGDEVIQVNKNDYSRYLRVLSSFSKDKLVEVDKLNKALGPKFKLNLSSEEALIKDGFLLVGKVYDLNFSIDPQIEKIKRDYEREIHNILYS